MEVLLMPEDAIGPISAMWSLLSALRYCERVSLCLCPLPPPSLLSFSLYLLAPSLYLLSMLFPSP